MIEANFNLINTYNRDNIFTLTALAPVYQLPVLPSLGVTIS
ncbi:MAG: hypothetical protein R3B47_11250 [Bacteroidia bacterium]